MGKPPTLLDGKTLPSTGGDVRHRNNSKTGLDLGPLDGQAFGLLSKGHICLGNDLFRRDSLTYSGWDTIHPRTVGDLGL